MEISRKEVPTHTDSAIYGKIMRRALAMRQNPTPAEARAYDNARQRFLEEIGLTVLRFLNERVLRATDAVLDEIAACLPSPDKETR